LKDAKTDPYYKRLKRKEEQFLKYESFYKIYNGNQISEETAALKKLSKTYKLRYQIRKRTSMI
jgi:hypothetical protein